MKKDYVMLMGAVLRALDKPDHRIAVVSKDDDRARERLRACFEIVTPLLSGGHVKLFHKARMLQFDNGSFIVFKTAETELRDHATYDRIGD